MNQMCLYQLIGPYGGVHECHAYLSTPLTQGYQTMHLIVPFFRENHRDMDIPLEINEPNNLSGNYHSMAFVFETVSLYCPKLVVAE